jgi:mannan polymerase II complex MNN10 subunit
VGGQPTVSIATSMRGPSTGPSRGGNFFGRHVRKFSSSLPRFRSAYAEKDKNRFGGGQSRGPNGFSLGEAIKRVLGRMSRKLKLRAVFVLVVLLLVAMFTNSRKCLAAKYL